MSINIILTTDNRYTLLVPYMDKNTNSECCGNAYTVLYITNVEHEMSWVSHVRSPGDSYQKITHISH